MKCGLFGGTFDPIHFGHLRAALELAGILRLDRVIFIPSAAPPHKAAQAVTPFAHRLQMVSLAVADNEKFSVSDVEGLREGKSFSIDTVRYFLETLPGRPELYFIIGQDAFDAITTWRDWEALLSLCHFAVMTRPGYENEGLKKILPTELAGKYEYDEQRNSFQHPGGKNIFFRRTTFLDISASDIRERMQSGQSVQYLTPGGVIRYMDENNLYR